MKKSSLKSLNFEANDLLDRQALKMIFGGYNYAGNKKKQFKSCTKNSDCLQGVCGGNSVKWAGVPKDYCV